MDSIRLIVIALAPVWSFVGAASSPAADLRYRIHWVGHDGLESPPGIQSTSLVINQQGECLRAATTSDGTPYITRFREGRETVLFAPDSRSGLMGAAAVAVSETAIHLAVTLSATPSGQEPIDPQARVAPPPGSTWHGVLKLDLDGNPAPIPDGSGPSGALRVIHGSLDEDASRCAVTGVWVHGQELFVSDAAQDRVRVLDAESLRPKRVFRVPRPGPLCVLHGHLQVVERGSVVTGYTLEGRPTGQVLDEGPDFIPGALAPTPEGRLMVADHGASQQVHLFNMSGVPTSVRTLGEEGGLYALPSPGVAGPRRLASICGLGADGAGNFYVSMNPPPGGSVLRVFGPDRNALRAQSSALVLNHGADFDPSGDGSVLTSTESRHAIDLDKPPGQSWRWVGQSVNPDSFPQDPRLGGWRFDGSPRVNSSRALAGTPGQPDSPDSASAGGTTTVREIAGQKFLIHGSADRSLLVLYRVVGHAAIPSLVINSFHGPSRSWPWPDQPPNGPWMWRDHDGNGRLAAAEITPAPGHQDPLATTPVDAAGALWRMAPDGTLARWLPGKSDPARAPEYADAPSHVVPLPPGIHPPIELHYDVASDSLFLAGSGDPTTSSAGSSAVLLCLDAACAAPNPPKTRWRSVLPGAQNLAPPGLHAAGPLVFAFDGSSGAVHVVDAAHGTALGALSPPAPSPQINSPPLAAAFSRCPVIRSYRRAEGNYIILAPDLTVPRVILYLLEDPHRQ